MSTGLIACPNCGEHLEDDGRLAGQLVKCPGCSREFRMPGAANPYRSPVAVDSAAEHRDIVGVPFKVQLVQILMVVGGVVALSVAVGWTAMLIGLLWPGTYYSYFIGFYALYRGVTMLNRSTPPRGTAVLQIVNLIAGDFVNAILGGIELVLLSDPEVEAYFAQRARRH